jgi:hypothetical protein
MIDDATGELIAFDGAGEAASEAAVDRMADAFVRYARDPALRSRQGAAARERVLKDFDARSHARHIQREIFGSAAGAT